MATPTPKAASTRASVVSVRPTRTLLAADLMYVPTGRTRPAYLLDAAMEAARIRAWLRTDREGDP